MRERKNMTKRRRLRSRERRDIKRRRRIRKRRKFFLDQMRYNDLLVYLSYFFCYL